MKKYTLIFGFLIPLYFISSLLQPTLFPSFSPQSKPHQAPAIIITQQQFSRLIPPALLSGENQTPSVWEGFDLSPIDELLSHFAKGTVEAVEDRHGIFHHKISFHSPFAKALYTGKLDGMQRKGTEELPKAKILAAAFAHAFGNYPRLTETDRKAVQKKILSHHDFINITNQNARKIFRENKRIQALCRKYPSIWDKAFEPFFAEVGQRMEEYIQQFGQAQDQVICLYSTAGGAHQTINQNLMSEYAQMLQEEQKIPSLQSVNETDVLKEEDVLPLFTGFFTSEIHNVIYTRAGNPEYAKKLKQIQEYLTQFVPNKKMEVLRRKVGHAPLLVNVCHHPDTIRLLVNENEQNVIFQLCDYGEVSAPMSPIMRKTIKYALNSIFFYLPSKDVRLNMKDEQGNPIQVGYDSDGSSPYSFRYRNVARLGPYPVHPNFKNPLSEEKKSELRKKLGFSQNSKIYILQMGTQGVGFTLEKYIQQLLTGLANDPNPCEIDVLTVCGHNESLRRYLKKATLRHIQEMEAMMPGFRLKVKEKMHFHFAGFIPNEQMGLLSHLVDMFVSKPGGAFTAEASIAKIATAIHQVDDLPWEKGNIAQLKNIGGVIIEEGASIYEIAKTLKNHKPNELQEDYPGTLASFIIEKYPPHHA